jgi:hypothetical protein
MHFAERSGRDRSDILVGRGGMGGGGNRLEHQLSVGTHVT